MTVSRVIVELVRESSTGDRFLVKPYPKDREHRRLKLNVEIAAKLHEHVVAVELEPDDLLFTMPKSSRPALKLLAHPVEVGLDRAEPHRSHLPPRHTQRLLRWRVPMPTLQGRLGALPL